jgi:hypothetical protein
MYFFKDIHCHQEKNPNLIFITTGRILVGPCTYFSNRYLTNILGVFQRMLEQTTQEAKFPTILPL